jgi:hypothetical protein
MAHPNHTPSLALLEEALSVLFCRIDDAYYQINPRGARYASLKELSDSEILTLALFQQLRGIESEHSFLREASRFFSHLFSRGSSAIGHPPSIVACASSGVTWSPCGARSWANWWESPRRW